MTDMLKLLRTICIWMCSTACLFEGYLTNAAPLEYFEDHEFSYDMDTAQSKVKYDPRLLSQQLKDQNNHPQERAASCYSATNKYTHGQRVSREDPCEVCLCVDGEIFCWWKRCGSSPKRRKFKLEKSVKLGKSKKDKTIEKIHRDQLHLKQKKKLDNKLRQQHWLQQQHQHQQQQQHPAVRSKILTFPENLPSVLYYDYKTEDQHGFQHGNHKKPTSSSKIGGGGRTSISRIGAASTRSSSRSREDDEDNEDDVVGEDDGDDASSAVGVAEPTSTEMKFGAKSHSAPAESSKKLSLQQTSTARITTTTTSQAATAEAVDGAAAAASVSEPFSSDHIKEDVLNVNNQFISGNPIGSMQMLSIDGSTRQYTPNDDVVVGMVHQNQNRTTSTQGETTFMLPQPQEHDPDGGSIRDDVNILRDGNDAGGAQTRYSSYNLDSNKQNNEPAKGVGTSFRSSFNDFSSEFNASAAMDLELIMGRHSAPIVLEADFIANANVSSLPLLSKHESDSEARSTQIQTQAQSNRSSNRDNLVLSTTTVTSTTVNQEQECIVMGATYKIGAILPQETGNCLQCICIEGATKDDIPRVTCSPHNCPPLVLPDLFDATGY